MARVLPSGPRKYGVRLPLILLLSTTCATVFTLTSGAETVYEALGRHPDLFKFYDMVNRDEVLRKALQHWSVTVFAPTNDAIKKNEEWVLGRENKIVAYHVLHLLANQSLFPFSSSSSLAGAPPVFLGVKDSPNVQRGKEFYVNNAKITRSEDYVSQEGNAQILYVIDEILRPYLYSSSLPPNAFELLKKPDLYDIREPLSAFLFRVEQEELEELFQREGNHTFFVPVGAGVGHSFNRQQEVDRWVIRGHVIPKNVIFTRLAVAESYRSEAFSDDIKAEISVVNESSADGDIYIPYAQSNTMHSAHGHKKGVVLSKILKPNIPVKNGVVHLIESPLMIIDISVWKFLNNEKESRLSEFLRLISYAPAFKDILTSTDEKTLFAPSNEAIRKLPQETIEKIKTNVTAITSLLKLHLVMKSISTDDVLYGRHREYLSADNRNSLYFRILGNEHNKTLTVDGGGVKAAAVQSDIGAVDGMVHIVDRLLGMPYQTIYLKLQSDPDLRVTYDMSEQDSWASTLDQTEKRFTFFVPSNEAWAVLRAEMPTEYKQLSMGLIPYHVHKILDRHLVVGQEIHSDALNRMEVIQMVHGHFKVKPCPKSECQSTEALKSQYPYGLRLNLNRTLIPKGDSILEWEGQQARIVRQDVQAINGIIHVIDRVLMKKRDLTKSSAPSLDAVAPLTLAALLIFKRLL